MGRSRATKPISFDARRAVAIAEAMHSALAGQDPAVQGAILAELLSVWLAGHAPDVRAAVLAHHLRMVREMTKINAHYLRGEGTAKH